MPLFNYGRTPGFAPGGRGINPETGRIGDMPGGMDFLAGFGPAPKGVTDWVDPAVLIGRRLATPGGMGRNQAQTANVNRWINLVGNNPAAISRLYPNQPGFAAGVGQARGMQMPTPSATTAPPQMPQTAVQGTTTPNAALGGIVGSFDNQWNDQNDPGGLIRKWQSQQANQGPWVPNWGSPGAMYGMGSSKSVSG